METVVCRTHVHGTAINLQEEAGIDAVGGSRRGDGAAGNVDPALLGILVVCAMDGVGPSRERELPRPYGNRVLPLDCVACCRHVDGPAANGEVVLADYPVPLRAGNRKRPRPVHREVRLREDRAVDVVPVTCVRKRTAGGKRVLGPFGQREEHLVCSLHVDGSRT